jgi:hypothetical protein
MKKNLSGLTGLIATVVGAVLMLAQQNADPRREYLRQEEEFNRQILQPILNEQRQQEAEMLCWIQQQQQQDAAMLRTLFGI